MAKKPKAVAKPNAEEVSGALPLKGLALFDSLYRNPDTAKSPNSYLPIQWKGNEDATEFVIASSYGVMIWPDGSEAKFTRDEAQEVFRFLSALRPRDGIRVQSIN